MKEHHILFRIINGITIKNKILKIMFQHHMKLYGLLMTPIININGKTHYIMIMSYF